MLWKKSWLPEEMMPLIGIIIAVFFFGNIAVALLKEAGTAGFRSDSSLGFIVLGTLSFQGAAILIGAIFLGWRGWTFRDVLGDTSWEKCLQLAVLALLVVMPVMVGLRIITVLALEKLHWHVANEAAVDLVLKASPSVRLYLIFFTIVLAPAGEEFVFRGLLYSTLKKFGWPKLGAIMVSLFFALIHANAPAFLPLFVFALALTWLYERAGGLLAPIMAHSLFNTINLAWLLWSGSQAGPHPE